MRTTLQAVQRQSAIRPPGYVEAVLSAAKQEDGLLVLTEADVKQIGELYPRIGTLPVPESNKATQKMPVNGPGTKLGSIFKALGFNESEGCGCGELAQQMNVWGVDGCRENEDVILLFLEAKAREKHIPFARLAAKAALELALAGTTKELPSR